MTEKKPLLYLAGAMIAVIWIILLLTWDASLDDNVVAVMTSEAALQAEQIPMALSRHKEVADALQRDPALFSDRAAVWREEVDAAVAQLNQAKTLLAESQKLAEEEGAAQEAKISSNLYQARNQRVAAGQKIAAIYDAVTFRQKFKKNRAHYVDRAKQRYRKTEETSLQPVAEKVEKAALDWPEKKRQLEGYLGRLEDMKKRASAAWQSVVTENAKPQEDIDWGALVGAMEAVNAAADGIEKDSAALADMTEQLYTSWDKILADMEVVEGSEVEFYHTYKIPKVTILDVASKRSEHTVEQERVKVSKVEYEKHREDLGMALETKPAGKFDSEATKTSQPAGYAHMASPAQGRNHYGFWQSSPGGSFWVWYGQYAFMRSLFGGGASGYRVYGRDWDEYYRARRAGRTYWGKTGTGLKKYGSKGTVTGRRYAGSRYIKTGGFRNTRYVRSGGSYRGSRYASSRGGSFRSGRRSSSLFGGGK